jgi:DNA processing protein
VGAVTYRELTATFRSASNAFDAAPSLGGHDQALRSADDLIARAAACGARLLLSGDPEYPPALADLNDPPPYLFALGTLDALAEPAVAIVGTRRATRYGERVARELAGALARAGVAVVSGLARGIDAVAHTAALDAGGRTVAVLGTGVDVPYPAAHRALHARVAACGLILAEEHPGDRASAASFPRRNRIIAAITQATIVIEAPAKSGALITATHALELGRTVAAVPGPIDSAASTGSNELLRDGAIVIASVADALALFGKSIPSPLAPPELDDPAQRAVWTALADGPADIDLLCARTALPARDCLAAVTALELRGAIECELTGEVRRR